MINHTPTPPSTHPIVPGLVFRKTTVDKNGGRVLLYDDEAGERVSLELWAIDGQWVLSIMTVKVKVTVSLVTVYGIVNGQDPAAYHAVNHPSTTTAVNLARAYAEANVGI